MNLSDVFKFTQGLGQRGHQIGRKVGDAIELLTLGVVGMNEELLNRLAIEHGVEGATTAKHKVEFSFYQLDDNLQPTKSISDLFGIIECKKVGVEQTIKQSFKVWKSNHQQAFHLIQEGYDFVVNPNISESKWEVKIKGELNGARNLKVQVQKLSSDNTFPAEDHWFQCSVGKQILIALDSRYTLHVLGPDQLLSAINNPISKCIVVEIEQLEGKDIKKINVNDSLPGPQTPEKAKQASFVSLDVRKKVLGQFDKTEMNKRFISVLVIGEAAHWEEKSRSMVRLCNDYNLHIPDMVILRLFEKFEAKFGGRYQDQITKTKYRESEEVRALITEILDHFDRKVLCDIETNQFVKFGFTTQNGHDQLLVLPV